MDLLLLSKRGRLLPNHTELAYREAVAKLKYLLAESYAPRTLLTSKRPSAIRELSIANEYGDDEAVSQSCTASPISGETPARCLLESRTTRRCKLSESLKPAPAELRSLIERQEDYIEQLEKESQYCREELRALVNKVREVVAENEALQDQSKTHFFEGAEEHQQQQQQEQPSIVLESRVSELEAQLTQARLELRQAREGVRGGAGPEEELERTRRQLEIRAQERERELSRLREREAEAQVRARRAGELAQQADCQRLQVELELARLRAELERRQDELREAQQEGGRRLAEEEQRAERQEKRAAELAGELAQMRARGEALAEELRQRAAELQSQLERVTADKEASERQARQEQARLQAELGARAARLERAEAELLQARREQLRLGDEVTALERQMNASRVVEETRVQQGTPQPIAKLTVDRSKEERDKDKELAALIYDLENKHASSEGVTDQLHDNELPHDNAALLASSKKRRVKVDLKVKVIPKKKSAQSEPPSKVPIP